MEAQRAKSTSAVGFRNPSIPFHLRSPVRIIDLSLVGNPPVNSKGSYMYDYRVTPADGVMHHFKSDSAKTPRGKIFREHPNFAIAKIPRIRVTA